MLSDAHSDTSISMEVDILARLYAVTMIIKVKKVSGILSYGINLIACKFRRPAV